MSQWTLPPNVSNPTWIKTARAERNRSQKELDFRRRQRRKSRRDIQRDIRLSANRPKVWPELD